MPTGAVPADFYRQALEIDLRSKREYTVGILSAMGGISKHQFHRFKALLQLSDEAIELADRVNLDEGKLRYVVKLPQEEHLEMIRHIIEFNLTVKQVKDICEQDISTSEVSGDRVISKQALQLARIIRTSGDTTANDLINALLQKEKQPEIALARIRGFKDLIEEAEHYLLNGMMT